MPGQDAKFAESAGAGGSDVRQGVGPGEQVARIAVDLGEHDQSDGEISGSVEDYGKQSQNRRREAEESAADGSTQNFISRAAPEARREGESRGQQPCQQKANSSNAHGNGPALAQEALYRLAESMRSAKIAVDRAAEVSHVKTEDVLFTGPRLAQGAHTFGVQAWVEFALVGIKAGSQPHQRRRKQSAQQDERSDRSELLGEALCDFPGPRFQQHFWQRHWCVLVHRRAARARGRTVSVASGFGVVNLFHGVHAAVGFGEQALDVETILRTECRAYAQGNQVAAGNFPARLDGQLIQAAGLFAGSLRTHPRSNDHEFISAHASNIIVASAGFLQMAGKVLQQVIAFEMAIEIVNLLEVVEVADHYGE